MSYAEENYHCLDEPFSEGSGFRRVGGQPARQPAERTVDRANALREQSLDYASQLFSYPVDGCIRAFQRVSGLECHLSLEACSHATARKTLPDMSKEE